VTPNQKRQIIESCYRLGIGTPAFCKDIVGVAFNRDGVPVLLVHKRGAIPQELLRKCEGKRIRIVKVPALKGDEEDWVVLH
jgi:hypothetical protein